MAIVRGLKNMNKALDKPASSKSDGPKAKWVKLEDGESVKVRFLQELDPDSPHYSESAGLGFIAVEHTNPKDYRRKALCTIEDQGRCWGCEQHRKDFKAGWKGRSRLYINVLIEDGKNDPYVGILSQGSSNKSVTPTLIEYAGEMGSISNLIWRMKRTGTKTDTGYTIIPLQKDETQFDTTGLELFPLEETAVREVKYEEQEQFFLFGDNEAEQSSDSATSSNLEW
jgi:hypothetical protein